MIFTNYPHKNGGIFECSDAASGRKLQTGRYIDNGHNITAYIDGSERIEFACTDLGDLAVKVVKRCRIQAAKENERIVNTTQNYSQIKISQTCFSTHSPFTLQNFPTVAAPSWMRPEFTPSSSFCVY